MAKFALGILGLVASIAVVGTAKADYEFRSLSGQFGGTDICLGIQSANRTSGAKVVVWTCDGSYNQRWNQTAFWTTDARFAHMTSRILEKPTATSGNRCLGLNGSNAAVSLSCLLTDSDPNGDGWWADFNGWYNINVDGVSTSTPCYSFKSKTNTITWKYLTTSGASGNQPTLQNAITGTGWSQQVWCPVDRSSVPPT